MKSYNSIDEYISDYPQDIRKVLEKVRKTIRDAAPNSIEAMSYKMPTFKLNGKNLIHFAGWKSHIAVYPSTSEMNASKELKKYQTGKGTFQFPLEKPIPYELIKEIVEIRLKNSTKH